MIFKLAQAAESAGAESMDTISCRKSSTGKVRRRCRSRPKPNPRAPMINFAKILSFHGYPKGPPFSSQSPRKNSIFACVESRSR